MRAYKFWFGGQGWKALWVALRRAHRDSQARGMLVRLLVSLLLTTAYPIWYLYQFRHLSLDFGRVGNLIVWGIAPVCILLVVLVGFIQSKLEKRAMDRDTPAVPAQSRLDIFRETSLLATLLERLGSEIGMEKELPEGIEVITRRVLLDRLTELNLRDNLQPGLRDILLAPDGHWPQELKNRAYPAWEHFYTLRWVLGLGDLSPLTARPEYKSDDARALFTVKQPDKLSVLPAWDIRPARDAAARFFNRCSSELTARNVLQNIHEQEVQQAIDVRERIQAAGYTADYLIGTRTIPEIPDQQLWMMTARAYHRVRMLALLVDVTSGEKPASEIRTLFSNLFLLPQPEESEETAPANVEN